MALTTEPPSSAVLLCRELAAAAGFAQPTAASRSNSPYIAPAVTPAAAAQPDDLLCLPGSATTGVLPLFKATPASPLRPEDAPMTAAAAPAHSSSSCSHSQDACNYAAHNHADEACTLPHNHHSTAAAADEPAIHHSDAAGADMDITIDDADGRGWQYALVTCPWLFKPCPACCRTHAGREVLMTYFDPSAPAARGLCGYCPDRAARAAAEPRGLLQIRRSTYHEVVKAADLGRLADVGGVQQYVINGAKVLFLRPRPQPRPPKGVAAPSRCCVDGRQLMDAAARYCSLQCKLEAEDAAYGARHALAAARAQVSAAQIASDLAAVQAAAAAPGAPAAAAAPPDAADQARGVKRAAGLMRYEGVEDSDNEDDATNQQHPAAGSAGAGASHGAAAAAGATPPRCGGRGKRQRAASAGVALAAAAARGVPLSIPSAPAASPADSGVAPAPAGAQMPVVAAAAPPAPVEATPSSSHDSSRSSTCRWHAKRRKGEPVRSPLQ